MCEELCDGVLVGHTREECIVYCGVSGWRWDIGWYLPCKLLQMS